MSAQQGYKNAPTRVEAADAIMSAAYRPAVVAQVDALVDSGAYKNRSVVLRCAVDSFLIDAGQDLVDRHDIANLRSALQKSEARAMQLERLVERQARKLRELVLGDAA